MRHELRVVFAKACESIRPFFDKKNAWAGSQHEILALHELKDLFPQLDSQDTYLVLVTVKRLIAEGKY